MIRWTPRFIFTPDDEVERDVDMLLPVGLWRHRVPVSYGGEIESDAGYPASFVARREYLLAVPVRYFEEEWPTVRTLIEAGQAGRVIRWYPDGGLGDFFDVYLETPALGEPVEPAPDSTYPASLSLTLVFRRVDEGTWDDLKFHEEVA